MVKLIKTLIFAIMIMMATVANASCIVVSVDGGKTSSYSRMVEQDVQETLVCSLVNAGYEIVERQQLAKVLKELKFHYSGMIDSNTAIEIGEMTGAEYSLLCNIVNGEVLNFNGIGYYARKAKLRMSYKLINNKTGRIVKANIVNGSASQIIDRRQYSRANDRVLLSRAAQEISKRVLMSLGKC